MITRREFRGFECPACRWRYPEVTDADFETFLTGGAWRCVDCGHRSSLWSVLYEPLKSDHPFAFGTSVLGIARTAVGEIELLPDTPCTLDLGQFGVPTDADVLDVVMTPQGGSLVPTLLTQSLHRGRVARVLPLRPTTFPGNVPSPTRLAVLVTWLPKSQEASEDPLVAAVEAFERRAYQQVIVPANVAVEVRLERLMHDFFTTYPSKEVDEFHGTRKAAFGRQLELLPRLMAMTGNPPVPATLMAALKTLKNLRNAVAHEHAVVSRTDASTALLAAVFGHRYLDRYDPSEGGA